MRAAASSAEPGASARPIASRIARSRSVSRSSASTIWARRACASRSVSCRAAASGSRAGGGGEAAGGEGHGPAGGGRGLEEEPGGARAKRHELRVGLAHALGEDQDRRVLAEARDGLLEHRRIADGLAGGILRALDGDGAGPPPYSPPQ